MTFRHIGRRFHTHRTGFDSRPAAEAFKVQGQGLTDWRTELRELAHRLMPAMVLVGAAVLGLAAVAMA